MKLWDTKNGELLYTLEGHKASVLSIAFSPDGKFLYSAGKDKQIKWWNLSSGVMINSIKAHNSDINQLIALDQHQVLSVSKDRSIKIHNAEKGDEAMKLEMHENPISSAAISTQDSLLYIGDMSGRISRYSLGVEKEVAHIFAHSGAVTNLCLSADKQHLLSSSNDKTSSLWNLEDQEIEQTFTGHTKGISYCSFGQDEKTIITTSLDSQIMVWSIQDLVQN